MAKKNGTSAAVTDPYGSKPNVIKVTRLSTDILFTITSLMKFLQYFYFDIVRN